MFSIEVTDGLLKLVYSSMDGLRNCFILRRTVCGIIFFFDKQFGEFFYSSTNHHLRKYWCVDVDLLGLSIVFIHEVCDKISNSNIPYPNEQNQQLFSRLWDVVKRRGDGKCYCPCSQCREFKRRIILIATATKHCREHGHTEGGNEYRPFVSLVL